MGSSSRVEAEGFWLALSRSQKALNFKLSPMMAAVDGAVAAKDGSSAYGFDQPAGGAGGNFPLSALPTISVVSRGKFFCRIQRR